MVTQQKGNCELVKDHKDKTSEHFKDKARKEFIWEQLAKSRKLSVKVCKNMVQVVKDMLQEAEAVKVWTGPEGDDGTLDLDIGLVPEVTHQTPSSKVIHTTQQSQVVSKGQHQSRKQPTSFLVIDDQQAVRSRPLTFILTPTKHFNPPSVTSATGKESQHNRSRLSRFFKNL